MKKYIAYIESPLQLFNLIEYIDKYNITIDCLVINKQSIVSVNNYTQIEILLQFVVFKIKIEVDLDGSIKNIIFYKTIKNKLLDSLGQNYNDVELISGEYRSRFFWFLVSNFKNKNIVILDDGTATLRINRLNNNKKSISSKIKKTILFFCGVTQPYNEKLIFFSVYNLDKKISNRDCYIRNNYTCFKKKLSNLKDLNDKVFIIGSPLLEAGVIACHDVQLTINLIHKLKKLHLGKDLVYIPHRRERIEKLDELSKYVLIERLDYPFEVYPLLNKFNIKYIAGFYSSLFDNLISIYGSSIHIDSYILSDNLLQKDWKEFVRAIYDNYKSYNSTISDISFHSI